MNLPPKPETETLVIKQFPTYNSQTGKLGLEFMLKNKEQGCPITFGQRAIEYPKIEIITYDPALIKNQLGEQKIATNIVSDNLEEANIVNNRVLDHKQISRIENLKELIGVMCNVEDEIEERKFWNRHLKEFKKYGLWQHVSSIGFGLLAEIGKPLIGLATGMTAETAFELYHVSQRSTKKAQLKYLREIKSQYAQFTKNITTSEINIHIPTEATQVIEEIKDRTYENKFPENRALVIPNIGEAAYRLNTVYNHKLGIDIDPMSEIQKENELRLIKTYQND